VDASYAAGGGDRMLSISRAVLRSTSSSTSGITFRRPATVLLSPVLVLGPWVVRKLRARQAGGETIREDTPERHRAKSGTPTMGGILILVAVLASPAGEPQNRYVWMIVLITAGWGSSGWSTTSGSGPRGLSTAVQRQVLLRCAAPVLRFQVDASRPGWPFRSSRLDRGLGWFGSIRAAHHRQRLQQ
jgi:hypothetical protein